MLYQTLQCAKGPAGSLAHQPGHGVGGFGEGKRRGSIRHCVTQAVYHQRQVGVFLARLRELIGTLEARVTERTVDLAQANTQLREEIAERQAAQAQVVAQERTLAAAEEREQLGRELHDGLGQVMGYVNVQAQAIRALLQSGQTDPAVSVARQLEQVAQDAHADVRAQEERRAALESERDRITALADDAMGLPREAPRPPVGPS